MKVNLTKIKVQPNLFEEAVEHDFTKEVANAIWTSARGVAEADFALRLFKAEGEIDITEEEAGFIENASRQFLFWAQKPILEAIGR